MHANHDVIAFVSQDALSHGNRVEVVLQWTEARRVSVRSFVNGIPTRDGGTHEQGLRDAVRSAVRSYMKTHDLMPSKLEISADDIREGVVAVINLFMVDPQSQGQTKEIGRASCREGKQQQDE